MSNATTNDLGGNFFEEFRRMMEHIANQIEANKANIIAVSTKANVAAMNIGTLTDRVGNIEDDVKTIKETDRITRSQRRKIKETLLSRVGQLLNLKYEGGVLADESIPVSKKYRRSFISKAYWDAKRKGVMEDPLEDTPKKNFQDCVDYLEAWTPEVRGGTAGYIKYLDKLKETSKNAKPRKKSR